MYLLVLVTYLYTVNFILFFIFFFFFLSPLDPALEPVSVKTEGGPAAAQKAVAGTSEETEDDISNTPYFDIWLGSN